MRKRFLPAPLLSLALFGLWLLLNHSTSVGHITLGALLGWAIPLLTRGLRPLPVRVRRPGTICGWPCKWFTTRRCPISMLVRFLLFPSYRRPPADFC